MKRMQVNAEVSKWAAIIGSPIDHSLSPILHETAYKEIGFEASYYRFDVAQDGLADFMRDLEPGCIGLSVTMPCKRDIASYIDACDSLAKAVGAVNTVVMSSSMRVGFNTDVHGIVEAVRDSFAPMSLQELRDENRSRTALILGTGATASSALAALVTLGYGDIRVVGRSFAGPYNVLSAANRLKVEFDPILWKHTDAVAKACGIADLVVSTVPHDVSASVADFVCPDAAKRVLDVVYAGGGSPLSRRYPDASVISPLRMLVHQGLAQVKLMTGKEAPFVPVYEAVVAASAI